MGVVKIAITLDSGMLRQLDSLVARSVFPNRSRALQQAISEKLERMGRNRLAAECAKLDPAHEHALAEKGMGENLKSWPAY